MENGLEFAEDVLVRPKSMGFQPRVSFGMTGIGMGPRLGQGGSVLFRFRPGNTAEDPIRSWGAVFVPLDVFVHLRLMLGLPVSSAQPI